MDFCRGLYYMEYMYAILHTGLEYAAKRASSPMGSGVGTTVAMSHVAVNNVYKKQKQRQWLSSCLVKQAVLHVETACFTQ